MHHPERPDRFAPRAGGAMASMFDGVTTRYDLLNRLMTLGRDRAWRRAMARAVPARARVVLDLCTGNGVSLEGLRQPGRLVIGADISLGMLADADVSLGAQGWAPRLVCADAFRLPLPDASVDAVTIAFGVRNLRPRADALAEIRRVLRPDGALVVLEATGPSPGPLAPFHRAHLRFVVPALGRLSPDPSAYRYLAESVLEFGDGRTFEEDAEAAGFIVSARRRFLAGATRLWRLEAAGARGEKPAEAVPFVQRAWSAAGDPGKPAHEPDPVADEVRLWTLVQAIVSAALTAALVWVLISYAKMNTALPLNEWQRQAGWVLLAGGTAFAALRTLALLARVGEGGARR